jgi:hypothetical protein
VPPIPKVRNGRIVSLGGRVKVVQRIDRELVDLDAEIEFRKRREDGNEPRLVGFVAVHELFILVSRVEDVQAHAAPKGVFQFELLAFLG